MVASSLATTTGWRNGSSRTLVPSRIRRVAAATKLSVASGSASGRSGGTGYAPSLAPGYSAMCSGR